MSLSQSQSIIYRDEFIIRAPTHVVAQFICQAPRILDYYPAGFRSTTFEANKSFACYGGIGASLLNVSHRSNTLMTLKVYNCLPMLLKRDASTLKRQAFFIMHEDWRLQSVGANTHVIKIWRDLHQPRLSFIPQGLIKIAIRLIAKLERRRLVSRWNRAAAQCEIS